MVFFLDNLQQKNINLHGWIEKKVLVWNTFRGRQSMKLSKTSAGFGSFLMATVIDLMACQGETNFNVKPTAICPTVTTVSDLAKSLTVTSYFDLWDPYVSTLKQMRAVKINEKPHVTLWNRASVLVHFIKTNSGLLLANNHSSGIARFSPVGSKMELGVPVAIVSSKNVSGPPDKTFVKKGLAFDKMKEESVFRGIKRRREESLGKVGTKKVMLYVFLSKDGYYSVVPTPGLIPFDNFYASKESKSDTEFKALKSDRKEQLFGFIKGEDKGFYVWLDKHPPWKLVQCCSYSEEEEKRITLELMLSGKGKHFVGGLRWKEVIPSLSMEKEKSAEMEFKSKYKKKRTTGGSNATTTTFVIGQLPVSIEGYNDGGDSTLMRMKGYKTTNYTCNHCGKYGHRSHNCWSLKKKKKIVVAC